MSLAMSGDLFDNFGGNVLTNIAANVFCVVTPILIVFGAYQLLVRRRLRKFFGIAGDSEAESVEIRLSSIDVTQSAAASPLSGEGFVGAAITAAEYQYAHYLVSALQSPRSARAAYRLLDLFGVDSVARPIAARIRPSLPYHEYLPVSFDGNGKLVGEIHDTLAAHRSIVLVGSSVYNVLTRFVLEHCGDQARVVFVDSEEEQNHTASAVKVLHPHGTFEILARSYERGGDGVGLYREYFVLQKILWNGETTIFIAAGTSTAATAAALTWLADKWKDLDKEWRNGASTVVVYSIQTADREMIGAGAEYEPWRSVRREWPTER